MTAPPLQAIAASLVLLALAAFTLDSLLNGRARHARFKALTQSADRQAALHRRLLRAVVQFGLFSIVGLAAIGRLGALWSMPPEIGRLRDQLALQALGAQPAETQVLGPILAVGIVAGALLASLAVSLVIARLRPGKLAALGDVQALLPRNAPEMRWCALICVNAGVSEELCFRLLAPLALGVLTHDIGAALVVAIAVFGLCHAYQGPVGVLATTLMGALMAGIYLLSGSLLLTMTFHVLIDLRALVLTPLLARRSGAALQPLAA